MSDTFSFASENPLRPEVKYRPRRYKVKRSQVPADSLGIGERLQPGQLSTITQKPRRPVLQDWSSDDESRHLADISELVKVLKEQGKVLWLSELRRIVKSGDQAACLCQMLYWFGRGEDGKARARLRLPRRQELWMAKTVEEFGREVGLSARQSRSALTALCESELIEKQVSGFSGKKTTYWRIVPRTISRALKSS